MFLAVANWRIFVYITASEEASLSAVGTLSSGFSFLLAELLLTNTIINFIYLLIFLINFFYIFIIFYY